MIKKDEVFKIGIFNKPHGVKGEISFTFTDDIFDRVECEYLVCLLDGIFVPFFIEEYRFRSDTTALVKLEGVDTSEKARMFTNVEVYFPKKYVGEEEDSDDIPTWNYFIGFKVEDVNHGELGRDDPAPVFKFEQLVGNDAAERRFDRSAPTLPVVG